jgi:hypothetical protein
MSEEKIGYVDEALEIELTNSSIPKPIDGENPLPLMAEPETHLDFQLARRIFQSVFSRYSAAKTSGLLLLIFGLLLTGAAYTIYAGIIGYCVWLLISS